MKNYRIILFVIASLLLMVHVDAQDYQPRKCYTHYMAQLNKDKFPNTGPSPLRSTEDEIEDEYVVIPVVIHIIHNDGAENISYEQARSQIVTLNEDFGHYGTYNQDSRGADTKIRFCLATIDPDGNPTSGIVKVKSELTDISSSDEMATKNLSRWDQTKYLNIWVVKSIDGDEQIQGYSYLPRHAQGPAFNGDGIVITYKYFGKLSVPSYYGLGRTTTHETGHYLDLLHIWGGDDTGEGGCDDDDGIEDTPVCSADYFSVYPTCEHPEQCGNTRLIEDFMDYSTDKCMSLFTGGQGEWMQSTIKKYRSVLVSYQNILETGCMNVYDSLNNNKRVDVYPNPVNLSRAELKFATHSKEAYDLNIYLYDLHGRMILNKTFEDVSRAENSIFLHGVRPGLYYLVGYYANTSFYHKIILGYVFD